MSFYPPKITERLLSLRRAGRTRAANAVGTSATLVCGSAARFSLLVERETKEIREARFQTNGCGYAAAAADVLADLVTGEALSGLHGLDRARLRAAIESELGEFTAGRRHCLDLCFEALERALAEYRASQIEEWTGETALICSCFGVSEETIERVARDYHLREVEEVTEKCGAGGGCGSCRMLIEEILDSF